MTNEQTISWIFLSIALASQTKPVNFNDISSMADGINHAVPTHKELQASIAWLTSTGLVEKKGKKYLLTEKGKQLYIEASKDSNILLKIWKNMENILSRVE